MEPPAVRDANMNHAHVGGGTYQTTRSTRGRPHGPMIWQDFMFGGAITPTTRPSRLADRSSGAVTRLRDHPSIVLWAGNNEVQTGWDSWPDREDFRKFVNADEVRRLDEGMRELFSKTLRKVAARPQTPYWANSPSTDDSEANVENDGLPLLKVWSGRTDSHTYVTPRFQSEYGLQSFPVMATIEAFAEAGDMAPESKVMRARRVRQR